jgi:hypothetical protein
MDTMRRQTFMLRWIITTQTILILGMGGYILQQRFTTIPHITALACEAQLQAVYDTPQCREAEGKLMREAFGPMQPYEGGHGTMPTFGKAPE